MLLFCCGGVVKLENPMDDHDALDLTSPTQAERDARTEQRFRLGWVLLIGTVFAVLLVGH